MKVIKITKKSCNSIVEHFMILSDTDSDSRINDIVEEWCEAEPSGLKRGYSFEWVPVYSLETIKEVLDKEIININKTIDTLNERKNSLIYFQSLK